MYQVPLDLCAKVMADEIGRHLAGETSLTEVVLVALDKPRVRTAQGPVIKGGTRGWNTRR